MKTIHRIPALSVLALACAAVPAAADDYGDVDGRLTWSTGIEFTSGRYGGDADIEDSYLPVSVLYERGRAGLRLTVPYLSVSAPAGTVITGPDGEPLPGSGERTTESGLGDIIGSVTVYDVGTGSMPGIALDLTAGVKFGTADEDRGLGTGETDFTLQADLYRFTGDLTLLGSVGYRFRGDPEGLDLDDSFLASAGGWYRFSPRVKSGIVYNYRESSLAARDAVQELTAFVSRRLGEDWRLQAYALGGLSDSSADWGAGLRLKRGM